MGSTKKHKGNENTVKGKLPFRFAVSSTCVDYACTLLSVPSFLKEEGAKIA